jgi:hypothetical protein
MIQKRRTESVVEVYAWCLQMKKTPTIILPSDASVEIVAVAAALLEISGTERNPTVALRDLQH